MEAVNVGDYATIEEAVNEVLNREGYCLTLGNIEMSDAASRQYGFNNLTTEELVARDFELDQVLRTCLSNLFDLNSPEIEPIFQSFLKLNIAIVAAEFVGKGSRSRGARQRSTPIRTQPLFEGLGFRRSGSST